MGKKYYYDRINFIFWEERGIPDPDLITRIYPTVVFMDKGEKKAPFLTDRCYTFEELNRELDGFQEDIENIRKRAKKKYDEFKIKNKGGNK